MRHLQSNETQINKWDTWNQMRLLDSNEIIRIKSDSDEKFRFN